MRGPHVRFCERRGGVILRAYSTLRIPADDSSGGGLVSNLDGRSWKAGCREAPPRRQPVPPTHSSSNSSAAFANATMLAIRSLDPVSNTRLDFRGKRHGFHAMPSLRGALATKQ